MPALRGRDANARREVRELAGKVVELGCNERVGGHEVECYSPGSLWSKPYTSESDRACHDASMMFSLTPIVVHVRSPFVLSTSTRVTAPVPLAVSSTRTL